MKYVLPIILVATSLFNTALLPAQSIQDANVFEFTRVDSDDGGYIFYGTNNHIIPIFVYLDFPQLQGLQSNLELPVQVVIPAETSEQELVRLEPTSSNRVSFRSSALYVRGDPLSVEHNDDHVYLLPYEHGRKYRVTQGYNGSFTHIGENQYAIDFDLEEGDPVHAARGGRVVEVKKNSTTGGPSARYSGDANFILIMHSDGTFGNYAHLEFDGALVEPGQQVEAGDLIGRSGNTGRSSGPHLHFDVRIPTVEGRMQSIPTRFANHDGDPVLLESGGYYYATHPGQEPFEPIFGSSFVNEDFIDHEKTIATGELGMRVKKVDSTIILFLQNGSNQQLEIETTLQLRGMEATTPLKITRTVAPNTEIFLSILRPLPEVRQFQYGYQFRYREVD